MFVKIRFHVLACLHRQLDASDQTRTCEKRPLRTAWKQRCHALEAWRLLSDFPCKQACFPTHRCPLRVSTRDPPCRRAIHQRCSGSACLEPRARIALQVHTNVQKRERNHKGCSCLPDLPTSHTHHPLLPRPASSLPNPCQCAS